MTKHTHINLYSKSILPLSKVLPTNINLLVFKYENASGGSLFRLGWIRVDLTRKI